MTQPRIIAIETSGRIGSAAVGMGPTLIAEQGFATQTEHARELFPTIDALCRKAGWMPSDIEHCYVSIGPGSFTGLRVAVTFARHLALAAGAKICAVPTLDVIAANALALTPPPRNVAAILDAKRTEVFGAVYELRDASYARLVEPRMTPLDRLLAGFDNVAVIGEGVEHQREALRRAGVTVLDSTIWWPQAKTVFHLGWDLAGQGKFTPARELVPCYIRRPEAEEVWEKRQATG